MHIEKINENKIKVIFMREDIQEWNVNVKNLAENTQEMQNMVWSVIRRAEKEVGFVANGAQLQVEAVPTKSDEIIMVITRICKASDSVRHIKTHIRQYDAQTQTIKRRARQLPVYIFRFSDFDDAVNGSKVITGSFTGRSALYKYEDKYYITLIPFNKDECFGAGNILSEYSEKMVVSSMIEARLKEYGKKLIADSAVEILAQEF